MPKLRRTVQREIFDALDESVFTSDDFTVEFSDPDKGMWLVWITFIHDVEFTYGVGANKHGLGHLVKMSPGYVKSEETNLQSFSDAVSNISDWCLEIRSELKATKPIYRELDSLRGIVEEHFSKSISDDEEFSVTEINILRSKFEELHERVGRLEKEKIITENQLKEFNKGISEIDQELDFYPKKTWIKTASNKLVKTIAIIGKSQEGRKLLTDSVRRLIGFE